MPKLPAALTLVWPCAECLPSYRAALERGWSEFERTGANDLKISLFLTLHVELWLRAREESKGLGATDVHERIAVALRH